ncbi:MAG: histidine kinase dimerization/phospho-acceptor domain-containing protein [Desulfuromonadales bacterium]|nr:histidine kinase dimerization/phospho-acceptor domain-containing protein [Desulfuromonadales bacterium]
MPATFCLDQMSCVHPGRGEDEGDSLDRCLECASFWLKIRNLSQGQEGETQTSLAAALLLAQHRIEELDYRLKGNDREFEFLRDVGLFLQGSLGREEVIVMALTAITAGKGYGLNRAVLLLVDEESERLNGYLAVGPRTAAEGWQIWNEIIERDESLEEMARRFLSEKLKGEQARFRDLLDGLSIPLSRHDHLFVSTLESRQSVHISQPWNEPGLDRQQLELLSTSELVLVPLLSGERRIGILLADNIVTGAPISENDLHRLETFALPVSYAIERAALYERLRHELNKLTEAHQRLSAQQEVIVRMEKLALIGEMSADIAHRIRNPLTIIGGYARRLLKGELSSEQRQGLEVILRQSELIGETSSHLLAETDSQHPPRDRWNLGKTIAAALLLHAEKMKIRGISCSFELPENEVIALFDLKKISYCLKIIIDRCLEALPLGGALEIEMSRGETGIAVSFSFGGEAILGDEEGDAAARQPRDIELALVMRMLKQQGGQIVREERPDGGATYRVILPDNKENEDG